MFPGNVSAIHCDKVFPERSDQEQASESRTFDVTTINNITNAVEPLYRCQLLYGTYLRDTWHRGVMGELCFAIDTSSHVLVARFGRDRLGVVRIFRQYTPCCTQIAMVRGG